MFKKLPTRRPKLSIAPLLDMVFILLIFFVVTTSFSQMPGTMINRPDAEYSDQLPKDSLLIGITKTGEFRFKSKSCTAEELDSLLQDRAAAVSDLSVVIVPDEDSAIKYSVTVMDLCKKYHIERVAIAEETVR